MPTFTDPQTGQPLALTPEQQQMALQQAQQPQEAPTVLPMGHVPNFTDPQTGQPLNLTPDQQKQARQAANVIDPLQDMTPEQMSSLAHQAPQAFTPLQAFLSRPDLHADTAVVQKAADAHRLFKDTTGALEGVTPGSVASSVGGFFKGLGKWALAVADTPLETFLPDAQLDPQQLAEKRAQQQRLAEAASGTAVGATSIANQISNVVRSLKNRANAVAEASGSGATAAGSATQFKTPSQLLTPEQKVQEFLSDVAHAKQLQEIATGHAGDPVFHELAKGGDWETTIANLEKEGYGLRPEEVSKYAAGDPITAAAFGEAFGAAAKLGGAVLPKEAIQAGLAAAGNQAARAAGGAISKTGTAIGAVGKGLEKAAPIVGTIAGAGKAAADLYAGDIIEAGKALALGPLGGKGVGEAGALGRKIAPTLQKFGQQVASGENITSATAQGVRDALQIAPVATSELAKGVAMDLGLAAAGETPEEKSGVGLGTVFGAAGALGRFVPHVVSGHIVGSRDWGSDTVVSSNGYFPTLDPVHAQGYANAAQGVRRRVNSVRAVLKSINPNADFIYAPKPAEGAEDTLPAQLVAAGVDPATAKLWSDQEGLTTHEINGKTLVLARDIGSAPHEAVGHGLENVLGESIMRQIDQVVQDDPTYKANWDAIASNYATRLGWDGKGRWQDFLLDKTGWGNNYAKEKALFQSQPVGPHAPGQADVVYDLAGNDWRKVLTPEEQNEAADSYISREIFAENADALFKRTGPSLQQTGLPYKIAKVVAAMTQALGAEPLAGRRSEGLGIPLSTPVIEAAQQGGTARLAQQPPVAPKLKISRPGTPLPVTPEQQQNAVDEARQAAAAAPSTPVAGGTKSPREILGAIAEAIASRTGVKLNYLSAPDEPAAAISSNRKVRRALIEVGRTLPAAARSLWEKTFFPERVLQNKDGSFQVSGWAPEVFAANVHRTAQSLNAAGHADLIPYPVDPKTGSLTPEGWTQLYEDTQKAVRNYTGGRTASGEDLVVPQSAVEAGAAKPPVRGTAEPLDQNKADFISAMFGIKLPQTTRISTRELGLPTSIVGEDISRATMPGRVEPPVVPRGTFEGKKAEALGIAGRQLMEVNPWRNRAEAAGFDSKNLIEARQNLNVDNIKEVQGAPEQPQFRSNTLTLQAGFMPERGDGVVPHPMDTDDRRAQFAPGKLVNKNAERLAEEYSKEVGLPKPVLTNNRPVPMELVKDLADYLEDTPHAPDDPTVKAGYKKMLDEMVAQGHKILESGVDVEPWPNKGEPYKSSQDMMNDVVNNNHLYFLPTATEFGKAGGLEAAPPEIQNNLLTRPSGIKVHGYELNVNEVLRFVHDYFGHGPEGNEFGPRGEFNALLTHMQMFSPEARRALLSELYMQSSWYFAGRHMRRPDGSVPKKGDADFVPFEKRQFADPKNLLPSEELYQRVEDELSKAKGLQDSQVQYMPGKDPRAIRAAAIRDPDTGKVYEGPMHFFARREYTQQHPDFDPMNFFRFEEGFTDNDGNFLSRNQAFERAKEMNQLKPVDTQNQKNAKAAYDDMQQLASERTQMAQFAPSKDPRAIAKAAVMDEDTGEIHTGPTHIHATLSYLESRNPGDENNLFKAAMTNMQGGTQLTDGFVTNEGEFLTRAQALQRAEELGQYKRTAPGQRTLESQSFERQQELQKRGYSPETAAQFATKKLPKPTKEYPDRDVPFYAWQDPKGNFYKVPTFGHAGWAEERGTTSEELFKQGWSRVLGYPGKENPAEDTYRGIYVDVDKPLTKAQRAALEDLGFSRKQAIVKGDDSKILIDSTKDFAPEYYGTPGHLPVQYQPKTFIVRHGSTEMNSSDPDKDLIRGHINVPLDEKGRREAKETADQIAQQGGVQHIISSDLGRTVETANAIAAKNPGATIETDPGLRPWKFGPTIEGKPTSKMLPRIQELTENPDMRPEGGETFNEFKDRFLDAFHRAQAANVDKNTAIVTHYRGTKLLDAWRATGVDNDSIDKGIFEQYDKSKKPGNVDIVDKTGAQFQAMPRKSKQDFELKESPGSLFSKAWILPNGQPVQLGGQWHHEWVNENPEIAKKYGLKSTTSGEENRVQALKAGFARVNYERNTGTLKVEARAQDWPKLSPSVKQLVKANLPKIDNMDVHLLDGAAKKIVDQDGVALHTYDAGEKMDHLPLITEPSSTTTFSPQASSEPKTQFLPSRDPDAIKIAAVRSEKDGEIFTGREHIHALRRAWDSGYDQNHPFEEGFLDNRNNFLNREVAYQRAVRLKQMPPEPPGTFGKAEPWLAAETFNDAKKAAQFQPAMTAPEPEEFKDIRTLPAALAKPNWAILTGTRESLGSGTDEVNKIANENLEKALIADGYNPIPVKGSYKGVDQGQNFLVTGMTPEQALEWGKRYGQESVLTPDGLLYQDGLVNPTEPTEHYFGDEAKKQDFYSQIEGGPAFSMGIDFSQKIPAAEARKAFEVRGPVTAGVVNPVTTRGRQRAPEEVQSLSLQHVLSNPDMEDFAKKVVEKIKTIPGFKNISDKNIPKALNEMVDRMKQNIRFLYDQATEGNRALWRTWYDLANKMTKEWGSEYGYHPDIVAAVNARLSPQTDWYNNVTLTRAVLDTFAKDPKFTADDRHFLKDKFSKIESDKDRNMMLDSLAKIKDGQKMSELDDLQAGMLMRAHNENTRSLLTHDHNLKLTGDYTGWGKPFDDLRSVVSILRNPSQENVNRELGNNHKVRSFYNNHVAPSSPDWTTVDTHAAAAATLMPYGSKDSQIKDVFGSPKHKASGYNGTYFLYQHAYEQVAKELGILPRELQSIVWEQMRASLSPEGKRSLQADKFEPILKVHRRIDDGKITPAEGRQEIMDIFHRASGTEPSQPELPIQQPQVLPRP